MSTEELKTAAQAACKAFACGTGTKADMIAAQQAYDLARDRTQQAAKSVSRKREQLHRQAILDSVKDLSPARVIELAKEVDCIRVVAGQTFLVPHTPHWAHWKDEDAIRHHGCPVEKADCLLLDFEISSDRKWDGTYGHLWTVSNAS